MTKSSVTTLTCFALLAGLVLAAPALAQECVPFQGIDHCPVGLASLSVGPDGLSVDSPGGSGDDGVVSRFAPTTFWRGEFAIPAGSGTNQATHFSSISGGNVTSGLDITPVNGRLQLEATFTGDSESSTYSVLIYDDGILVGSLGNFSGDPDAGNKVSGKAGGKNRLGQKIALYIDGIYMGQIEEPWWWPWVTFGIANNGGCNWGVGIGHDVLFTLPDGNRVVGDEVRFTEDVKGPNHYPYLGFEAIETRSTASTFTLTDEMAEGTRE